MSDQDNRRGGAHAAGRHVARPAKKAASAQSESAGKKTGLWIALAAVLAVVLFLGYSLYGIYLSDAVFGGIRMGEVNLSGMDRSRARDALEQVYGAASLEDQLVVRVSGTEFPISAAQAGLSYDIGASVENAYQYGRSGGFGQRFRDFWSAKLKKPQLELATQLDESMLRDRISEMSEAVAQPMAQSSFQYEDGVITLDKGQEGYALDADDLLSQMKTALRTAVFAPIEARQTISQPAPLDADAILAAVSREPKETTLDLEADPSGKTILPGEEGVLVDASAVKSAIALPDRITTVRCELVAPKYTVSEYKALLFRDVLGKGTTDFNPGNVGRTTNVLLATDHCNGVILMPGDVFSYNDTVGPRTYERGFQDATIYVGDSAEDGVGGGICQVSSTIYYAALRADLKIVERYAHSRMVTYVPLGEDATVAWGSKDFRFENNTDFPILVSTSHTGSTLTVKLIGTKTENKTVKIETNVLEKIPFEVKRQLDTSLPAGTEKTASNGYTGYQTESYRVVYIDGKQVSRTLENKSSYTKYDKIIKYNDAAPTASVPVTPTAPETQPEEQSSSSVLEVLETLIPVPLP